jgi:hypothetical protein
MLKLRSLLLRRQDRPRSPKRVQPERLSVCKVGYSAFPCFLFSQLRGLYFHGMSAYSGYGKVVLF